MKLNSANRRRAAASWSCRFRPGFEHLESRIALHSDDLLFVDLPYLSMSFAPDGTDIGGMQSVLFAELNAIAPTDVWQTAILNAFQAWAQETNGDVGVVPDQGDPFGTPGALRRDARFGDVRIGAIPMKPTVYAVSIPRAVESGSWSGDVIFNSSLIAPNPVNSHLLVDNVDELYRVSLHEAGHVFGLPDNMSNQSIMNYLGIPPETIQSPAADDIDVLHTLSGSRALDDYEPNDSVHDATKLHSSVGDSFDGSFPAMVYADMGRGDVDVYELNPPDQYTGTITLTVRTDGVSLLQPKFMVTACDDAQVLASVTASPQATGGETLRVTVPVVNCQSGSDKHYVHVAAATGATVGLGGYSLAATYDELLDPRGAATPADYWDPVLDRFGGGEFRFLSIDDFEVIFAGDPAATWPTLRNDLHTDDTPATAFDLPSLALETSRYEVVGSLSDPTDIDYYRIDSEHLSFSAPALIVVVEALEDPTWMGRVDVRDLQNNPLPIEPLVRHDGRFVFQVQGISAETQYLVRVAPDVAGGASIGNYRLSAIFGERVSSFRTQGAGTLSGNATAAVTEKLFPYSLREPRLVTPVFVGEPGNSPLPVVVELLDGRGDVMQSFVGDGSEAFSTTGALVPRGLYRWRVRLQDPPPPVGDFLINFSLRVSAVIDPLAVPRSDPSHAAATTIKLATELDDVIVFPAHNQQGRSNPPLPNSPRPDRDELGGPRTMATADSNESDRRAAIDAIFADSIT